MSKTIRVRDADAGDNDDKKVTTATLAAALDEAWQDLRESETLRAELKSEGVDPDALVNASERPFESKTGQGVDGVTAFAISIGTSVAAYYTRKAMDAVWAKVILPALRRKFGNKFTVDPDEPS